MLGPELIRTAFRVVALYLTNRYVIEGTGLLRLAEIGFRLRLEFRIVSFKKVVVPEADVILFETVSVFRQGAIKVYA